MSFSFDPDLSHPLHLPPQQSWPESRHSFDMQSVWAVRAAIASGRPLLLRGEPGIGKSQLARAVAVSLDVPFLYHVVDERSERDDLLFSYDAVSRLAEAQVCGLIAKEGKDWRSKLKESNYVRPGVLWWAFDWKNALAQAEVFSQHCRKFDEPEKPEGWDPESPRPCGPVVLVDEIDKADPSVPNGLLESLGNNGFQSAQLGEPVCLPSGGRHPLVIITTNEERELPVAFLRRCLVLHMRFPATSAAAEKFLIQDRARVFWQPAEVSDNVCREVVRQLLAERENGASEGQAVPGAAEFIDILRVLVALHPGDEPAQLSALKEIGDFALKKNLEES